MDDSGMRPVLVQRHALEMALEEAGTVPKLKTLHDELAVLQELAKRVRVGLVDQNRIAEYRIRVARKAGGLLASTVRRGGDAKAGSSAPLPEGISWSQSSRWQKLAVIEEEVLRDYLDAALEHEQEVTMAGLVRASQNGIHFRSESDEWYTPREVVDAAVEVLGCIDLDPCSNSKTEPNVPAREHFTRADDGLSREWHGRVFLSPPYGSGLPRWIEKLLLELGSGRTSEAIALVPSRTDTEWFRLLRKFPRCFIHGRLRFNNHVNGAPFPSMAVYLGTELDRFAQVFSRFGDLYVLQRRPSS